MRDPKLDVVGCGSMVVDLIYRTPRILRADEKILLHHHGADGQAEQRSVGGVVRQIRVVSENVLAMLRVYT